MARRRPKPRPVARRPARSAPAWLPAILLVAAVLAAYFPAMQAEFIWDDDDYVENNSTLRTFDGLRRIWLDPTATPQYYPLVHTTFWIEYHLWGLSPTGYHVNNILLHAASAVLLACVLLRLRVPGAWWAAALFALHPVCVESVAWVTERKNVLSLVFYLAAMLAYFRLVPPDERDPPPAGRWPWYVLAIVFFAAALLSKSVTCSLPAALLLIRCWKWGRWRRIDVLTALPLFILGLAAGLSTAYLEKVHVRAEGAEWELSLVERCLVAGRAPWFYLAKLVLPVDLSFIYPRWQIDARAAWQYLFPLATLALLGGLFLARNRIGRGPLVATLFFGGTLLPALGFVDVYPFRFSYVADHFQYLACLGPIALAGVGIEALVKRLPVDRRRLAWGALVLPMTLGILTWSRSHAFHDRITLWTDTLAKNDQCWLAYSNRGKMRYFAALEQPAGSPPQRELLSLARTDYEHSLAIRRQDANTLSDYALLVKLGGTRADFDRAAALYAEALRVTPDFPAALNGQGVLLLEVPAEDASRETPAMQRDRLERAVAIFARALEINPDFPQAWTNLANAHDKLSLLATDSGRAAELERQAVHEYGRALAINGDNFLAEFNLGCICDRHRDFAAAWAHFRAALVIEPQNAMANANAGAMLHELGRQAEAVPYLIAAIEAAPQMPLVREKLAQALHSLGGLPGALDKLDPATRQRLLVILRP